MKRKRTQGNTFKHSKGLGQNFLIDGDIVRSIAVGSGIDDETLVIEIGPGDGALTEELAARAKAVTAVELDDRLIPILRTRFALSDNVEILHGDIMEVDIKTLIDEKKAATGASRVSVVGNLPYYITTPIIMKLLESNIDAGSITVMVQKEVGERLLAEPGSKKTGAITYAVHYRCVTGKVCDAPKECFYPVPKVDSMVIRLDLREEKAVAVKDEEAMFRLIKAGFSQRRKTLLNSLPSLGDMDKDTAGEALAACGIAPERRAETLTLEEFASLADWLYDRNA